MSLPEQTPMTKIFFDIKFTGFHKLTTPISIGLYSEDGRSYYAEFSDFDKYQINERTKKFTDYLILEGYNFISDYKPKDDSVLVLGDHLLVKETLLDWLTPYKENGIEMWGDGISFQWVIFISIFGNIYEAPDYVLKNPMDLKTTLNICNINRVDLLDDRISDTPNSANKAYNSFVIYEKIMEKFHKPEPEELAELDIEKEPKAKPKSKPKSPKPKKSSKKIEVSKKAKISEINKPNGSPDFVEPTKEDIKRLSEKWNPPL